MKDCKLLYLKANSSSYCKTAVNQEKYWCFL